MSINKHNTPQKWSIKKLGDIFTLSAGGDVDKSLLSKKQDAQHPYPIYANALIDRGLYGYSSNYRVEQESITITGRGDIGKVFYRAGKYTPIVRLVIGVPKKGISAKYMSYACSKIRFFNETTGVSQLTVPQVAEYKVAVPPLPEQEKIARILGCWDEAIEQMQNLINEKKELKRGLMQHLLTSRVRIHGFIQQWKQASLQEIASVSKGTQLNRIDMIDSGFPVFNGGTTESGFTNKWNTEKNTIIISEGGNSCGFVNYITKNFWAGGHCYTVVPKDLTDKNFLYQLLKYKEPNIMKLRVGSGLPNIQQGALNKFKLFLPSDVKEQRAIADILISADSEIALLNKKLDVLKEQKRGLMQKLLTGEIRVKAETE